MQMIRAQQGIDPFAEGPPPPTPVNAGKQVRQVPAASNLPVLTPAAFDAMFPGKKAAPTAKRRRSVRR